MKKLINIFVIFFILSSQLQAGAWSKAWKKVRLETKVAYHKTIGNNEHAKEIRKQKKYQNLTIHREDFKKDFGKIKSFSKKSWSKIKEKYPIYWKKAKEFSKEHKTELIVGGIIVLALIHGIPPEAVTVMSLATAIDQYSATKTDYTNLQDGTHIEKYKEFTPSQKQKIIKANMKRNGGVLKSDLSGKILQIAKQHQKGVTPPQNEVQIDHIIPRSKGGENSYANAQVLSRAENLKKSDIF